MQEQRGGVQTEPGCATVQAVREGAAEGWMGGGMGSAGVQGGSQAMLGCRRGGCATLGRRVLGGERAARWWGVHSAGVQEEGASGCRQGTRVAQGEEGDASSTGEGEHEQWGWCNQSGGA